MKIPKTGTQNLSITRQSETVVLILLQTSWVDIHANRSHHRVRNNFILPCQHIHNFLRVFLVDIQLHSISVFRSSDRFLHLHYEEPHNSILEFTKT